MDFIFLDVFVNLFLSVLVIFFESSGVVLKVIDLVLFFFYFCVFGLVEVMDFFVVWDGDDDMFDKL